MKQHINCWAFVHPIRCSSHGYTGTMPQTWVGLHQCTQQKSVTQWLQLGSKDPMNLNHEKRDSGSGIGELRERRQTKVSLCPDQRKTMIGGSQKDYSFHELWGQNHIKAAGRSQSSAHLPFALAWRAECNSPFSAAISRDSVMCSFSVHLERVYVCVRDYLNVRNS